MALPGTSVGIVGQLYQGLAAVRQNVDVLLGEAAQLGGGAPVAAAGESNGVLEAKMNKMESEFESKEQQMETRMDKLEKENQELKEEVGEQSKELNELEGGKKKATKGAFVEGSKKSTVASAAAATEPWNATFSVVLDGKEGGPQETFTIRVHPEWAPEGAKRFAELVQQGVFAGERFFRVVPHFMVQFGIPAEPKVAAAWIDKRIPDDPVKKSNSRGMVTFATSGPNSRTTQMFVNFANNAFLDKQGFAPFAEVIGDGMNVVDSIQSKFRERPKQGAIQHHGNAYLKKHFPGLSFINHVDVSLPSSSAAPKPKAPAGNFLQGKHHGKGKHVATFFHKKRHH